MSTSKKKKASHKLPGSTPKSARPAADPVGVPVEQDIAMARLIAIVVRNAMENFHAEHLSDDQMRQLNPLIRNGILTALHAARHMSRSAGANAFIQFQTMLIPAYWEEPQLLADYVGICQIGSPLDGIQKLKKAVNTAKTP